MSHDPVLHLLGLARKAGRLEAGEEPAGAACRARQAKLLLLAADAAPNTCRRAAHFGEAGNVLWLETPFGKSELGFILGRSSCAILALTDAGFAAAVVEKLSARDPQRYAPGRTGSTRGRRSSASMKKISARASENLGRHPQKKRRRLGPRRPVRPKPAGV